MTRASFAPALWAVAALLSFAALGALLLEGAGYYRLPPEQRPLHPQHARLRPSGAVGLSCALAGTGLFVLSLFYLVRKRLVGWKLLGTLRSWMACHVFAGLAGTACIVAHSALRPRSALGTLAFIVLGIVVVAGIVGRWIYAHMPRTATGRELGIEELRGVLEDERRRLTSQGASLPPPPDPLDDGKPKGLFALLAGMVAGDRQVRLDFRRFRAALKADPALRRAAPEMLPAARAYYRDRQRLARYADLRALMGTWRFLHRWLALLMLLLVAFHVIVAVRFGGLEIRWPWPVSLTGLVSEAGP